MKILKYFILLVCMLAAGTTAIFFLSKPKPRDWTDVFGRVFLESGALVVERTRQDVQNDVPTNVYVRTDFGLKSARFDQISDVDRRYVLNKLGLSNNGEYDFGTTSFTSNPYQLAGKEKFAFLVAASDYERDVVSLRFPDKDVEALGARLIEIGFRKENVFVLRSNGAFADLPTKRHIEERFKLLLSRVQPGDLVLVYLSGHGLQLDGSDVSYFAPVDVRVNDILNTSVSINEMMRLLSESPAFFRWMIVDACRNVPSNAKSIFTVRASGVKRMALVDKIPDSIALLQSCQIGCVSYEGGGERGTDVQNGLFTLALLEAIGEEGNGDLDKDGVVSFFEICQYVSMRTNVLANQFYDSQQQPSLFGRPINFSFLEDLEKRQAFRSYQEALDLKKQKKYALAFEKIQTACRKDSDNQRYIAQRGILEVLTKVESKINEFSQKNRETQGKIKKTKEQTQDIETQIATLTTEIDDLERLLVDEKFGSSEIDVSNAASCAWSDAPSAGTRKTLTYKGVEFAFRYCPAGSFMMGSSEKCRQVTLTKGFWIQETETTQAQWDVIGVPKKKLCLFKGEDLPVDNVSWTESCAYISELNKLKLEPQDAGFQFLLPTEAQWEYACRAGTQTEFFWGNSLRGDKANCNKYAYKTVLPGKSLGKTCAVRSYAPNPWGIYDMHGNVSEWCLDCYVSDYNFYHYVRPEGEDNLVDPIVRYDKNNRYIEKTSDREPYFVYRGGDWKTGAQCCNSFDRSGSRDEGRGFRLILTYASDVKLFEKSLKSPIVPTGSHFKK